MLKYWKEYDIFNMKIENCKSDGNQNQWENLKFNDLNPRNQWFHLILRSSLSPFDILYVLYEERLN